MLGHEGRDLLSVDATDWRAEHAIRPAVVTRKVDGSLPGWVRSGETTSIMLTNLDTIVVLALGVLVMGLPGFAQTRDAAEGNGAAETAARQALETFITQWNTADDANLRRAMHFPFATVPGGGALIVDARPEDFSAGFDEMRAREGWSRSSFDFDSFVVVRASTDKVHASIGFSRHGADGTAYRTSRVFYIVTRQDDRWAIQLRTPAAEPEDLGNPPFLGGKLLSTNRQLARSGGDR